MRNPSTIYLDTSVLFEKMNNVLAQQGVIALPGNLSIHSLNLKGDATWLYVVAEVKGPYNGTVIAQCKPGFNNATRRFSIRDFDIQLGEDSFLAKIAGKFVNSFIADRVDNKLEDVVNEKFMTMLNDIFSQLRNLSLSGGGTVRFDTKSFNLHDVHTDIHGLHFVAELTGEASLEY